MEQNYGGVWHKNRNANVNDMRSQRKQLPRIDYSFCLAQAQQQVSGSERCGGSRGARQTTRRDSITPMREGYRLMPHFILAWDLITRDLITANRNKQI